MKRSLRVRLMGLAIVAAGVVLAAVGPGSSTPAWAGNCLEPPCATTPCHTCTQCIFASGCYSEGASILQGPPEHQCRIYCNMPDNQHTCSWWSDCI